MRKKWGSGSEKNFWGHALQNVGKRSFLEERPKIWAFLRHQLFIIGGRSLPCPPGYAIVVALNNGGIPQDSLDCFLNFSTVFLICSWKSDTEGKGIKSKSRADSAKSLPERISNQGNLHTYLLINISIYAYITEQPR